MKVLRFSMQEEDIIEHMNAKCHVAINDEPVDHRVT